MTHGRAESARDERPLAGPVGVRSRCGALAPCGVCYRWDGRGQRQASKLTKLQFLQACDNNVAFFSTLNAASDRVTTTSIRPRSPLVRRRGMVALIRIL